MKKIILLIIIALITIFVFSLALNSPRNIETNYEKIRSLEVEKNDVLFDLYALEREYDLKLNGKAMSFLLFSDFNTAYYKEITNLLDKYGYYGTLILSKECFPTKDGYLTLDQFNALIKKGWNYCILYDNPEQFEYLHKLFEANGMKTDTVYFNKGKYRVELDEYLKSLGYKSIVHHGEQKLNLYKDNVDNGIWHVGSMGLVGNSPKAKLLEAVDVYGSFAFTVSFDENSKDEYYDYGTFRLVMDCFNALVNKDALNVTDLERGLILKQDIEKNFEENKKTYNSLKETLNKNLKEIENKIEELERE